MADIKLAMAFNFNNMHLKKFELLLQNFFSSACLNPKKLTMKSAKIKVEGNPPCFKSISEPMQTYLYRFFQTHHNFFGKFYFARMSIEIFGIN
jgi:hypothetical protein